MLKGVSLVKLIEPPCTERYARWCERSVGEIIAYLLLDHACVGQRGTVLSVSYIVPWEVQCGEKVQRGLQEQGKLFIMGV